MKEFRSMLSAVAYILGDAADHYFELVEDRETVAGDIEQQDSPAVSPGIASTLIEFAADSGDVIAVTVASEAHYGSILAHYTSSGDIVRFVAIGR